MRTSNVTIVSNDATFLTEATETGSDGKYAFPVPPIGHYSLFVTYPGLRTYKRTYVIVDANSALVIDVSLQPGQQSETVTVTDSAVHIETTNTQMGEVISGREMTAVHLNGRAFTDLLSLQPGVAPATSINANTVQDVGASTFSPSAI